MVIIFDKVFLSFENKKQSIPLKIRDFVDYGKKNAIKFFVKNNECKPDMF